jgi:hypothetical protein
MESCISAYACLLYKQLRYHYSYSVDIYLNNHLLLYTQAVLKAIMLRILTLKKGLIFCQNAYFPSYDNAFGSGFQSTPHYQDAGAEAP